MLPFNLEKELLNSILRFGPTDTGYYFHHCFWSDRTRPLKLLVCIRERSFLAKEICPDKVVYKLGGYRSFQEALRDF